MLARHHKFLGVLALLCGMSACTQPELLGEAVGENDADAYVVQSTPLDTKEYRYVELDNGMRVLLISDAEAVQAAASLRVAVGSYQDPEAWEGLAHFLEHMLFLGTKKYPQAGEYQEFIAARGGSHNAYTAFDHTNYFFDVHHARTQPLGDLRRPVRTPIIGDDDLAGHLIVSKKPLRFLDARLQRFGLVQARHHDGEFRRVGVR